MHTFIRMKAFCIVLSLANHVPMGKTARGKNTIVKDTFVGKTIHFPIFSFLKSAGEKKRHIQTHINTRTLNVTSNKAMECANKHTATSSEWQNFAANIY